MYAMYLQPAQKGAPAVQPDSLTRYYAGNTEDVKTILEDVGAGYKDSARQAWSTVAQSPAQLSLRTIAETTGRMPDVRNMTLKDALYLLENGGVKVEVKGHGKVLMQDVAPGTPISKAQTVTLLLN